jgi:hypothetical protein
VDLEILPEPSDEERQAIVAALRLEAGEDRAVSPWRAHALLAEKADDDRPGAGTYRQA